LTWAQDDDLYFVPSKVTQDNSNDNTPAYYWVSDRKVDEFNRRGTVQEQVSDDWYRLRGNDIISFGKGVGVYPDPVMWTLPFIIPFSPPGG
jgi:hypothetical protein